MHARTHAHTHTHTHTHSGRQRPAKGGETGAGGERVPGGAPDTSASPSHRPCQQRVSPTPRVIDSVKTHAPLGRRRREDCGHIKCVFQ